VGACDPRASRVAGEVPVVALSPLWWRLGRRLGHHFPPRFHKRRLLRWIEQPEASAVLCHYANFALRLESVWRRTSKPVFVHCHGYDVTWDGSGPARFHRAEFGDDYRQQIVRLAGRVVFIANSRFTQSRLVEAGIPESRIAMKYLGTPVPDRPRERPPRATGLKFLYLGRLVDFKGPLQTIEAFERACGQGLDATLTLAGDGPLGEACRQRRDRSPVAQRIRLLGAVSPEMGSRLRAEADLFTAHNRLGPDSGQSEALGVSVIEAMADALPVVTGRHGGVRETVVDGRTGVLFEPGDVEAHARAMLELAHDPRRREAMGRAGWRRASECFSLETEKKAFSRIFEEFAPLAKG